MSKSILWAGASLSVLVASASALPAAAQAPAEEPAVSALSEVVVTARRREEAVQDVPIAVQVFTQERLEKQGISEVKDIAKAVPGVVIGPGTFRDSTPAVVIRGFASGAGQIDADPSIPFIVNEVPFNVNYGLNSAFFDLENVQVLKGPQGTLQGRNTVGGAVLITTRRPSFDGFGGYVTGTIGNYDHRVGEAVLNIPVNEQLALRFGVRREKRDGTWINVADGRDYDDKNGTAWRASALWRPTDTIENYTVADYLTTDNHGSALVFQRRGFNFNDPASYPGIGQVLPCTSPLPAVCARHNLGIMLVPGFFANLVADEAYQRSLGWGRFDSFLTDATSPFGRAPFEKTRNWGISNTTTWDINDDLTLKNIVGYRKVNFFYHSDIDGTSRGVSNLAGFGNASSSLLANWYAVDFEQVTEELQVQGSALDNRAKWIGGLFYSWYQGTDGSDTVQFGARNVNPADVEATSFALYGQMDVDLTDQVSVTGGYRYTWDHREIVHHKLSGLSRFDRTIGFFGEYGQNRVYPTVTPDNFTRICNFNRGATSTRPAYFQVDRTDCTATRTLRGSAPSYNITIRYKPQDDLMVYLAHRQGYRAGYLAARAIDDEGSINRDEQVRDLELGLKSDFRAGGMPVRFNAAGYHAWYTNIAVSIPKIDPLSGTPVNVAENSGAAVLYGGEASLEVMPLDGLTLSASYGYTYGRYDNFPPQTVNDAAGNPLIFYENKNLKFAYPRHTFTLGASYTLPLDSTLGEVTASLHYFHASKRPDPAGGSQAAPKFFKVEPAYGILNGRLQWSNVLGRPFDLAVFGNNLTDEHYLDGVFSFEDAAGFRSGMPADPRTYGVSVTYHFGAR